MKTKAKKEMRNKPVRKTEAQWKKQLIPEQYHILREKGTEPPETGEYLHNKKEGMYVCAGCGNKLFASEQKFESGSGWPSFWAPAEKKSVATQDDNSMGMRRTEVLCRKCGGHLGHMFDDGPETVRRADGTSVAATGLRFCINSGALGFREGKGKEEAKKKKK